MNDHGIKWHRWYGNLEMFFKTKALVFNLPKKAERIKARHSENIKLIRRLRSLNLTSRCFTEPPPSPASAQKQVLRYRGRNKIRRVQGSLKHYSP